MVSVEDLSKILKTIDKRLPQQHIDKLIADLDTNKSGKVDFTQFLKGIYIFLLN